MKNIKRISIIMLVLIVAMISPVLGTEVLTEERITTDGSLHSHPDVYGDIVVWHDDRNSNYDIYGKNLKTGENLTIYVGPGDQLYPAIYGDIVVWQDYRNGIPDIYGKNLKTGENLTICVDPQPQQ